MATKSKNMVPSLNPTIRRRHAATIATNRCSARLIVANHAKFTKSGVPRRVLYYSRDCEWVDFETEVVESIKQAFSDRKTTIELSVRRSRCLFDFTHMVLINLDSDKHRPIAWIDVNSACFFPEILEESFDDNSCETGIDFHADGNLIKRKGEGMDGKEEPEVSAIESFGLRGENLILECLNQMTHTSASAGMKGINIIEELPPELLDLVLSNVVKQSPSDLGNIKLTSKHLYKASMDPWILKDFDANHLAPKLPNLDDHGERFLTKLSTTGNKEAMLLLGTHLFFKRGSEEDGLQLLQLSAEPSNAQGLYNYSIALIISRKREGFDILRSVLEQNEPLKKTIGTCRINFRKMLDYYDFSHIPRTDCCIEEGPNHWNRVFHPRFLQNEEEVSCTLCGIDIETFKLRNDFA